MITREEILKQREEWYKNTFVLFEIVKNLNKKELCLLSPKTELKRKSVRYLLANSIDLLKKHFVWSDMDINLINIYHSMAKFKDNLPLFSYNLIKRTKEKEYIELNENYLNYVESYNLFFDFDGKENIKECYNDVRTLKEQLDFNKVPYYIVNSSFKGFHIVIPNNYMPVYDFTTLLNDLKNLIDNISAIHNLKTLDTGIIDAKRVQKCPYSYSCDGSIVLPLTDFDFNNFVLEKVSYSYVRKYIMIKNRGLKVRDYGLREDELKKNVIKFINDYKA